jgi:hypothetical protein
LRLIAAGIGKDVDVDEIEERQLMTVERNADDRHRQAPDDDPDLAVVEGDATSGDARHYRQDPDGLLQNERDEDERDADDLLEPDQTELEELGLILDDPHQPE